MVCAPLKKSRNTKKNCVYANFFEEFARTFPCFPVTRVRNPTKIVQINSFRWTFLFWVDFFGWILRLWKRPKYRTTACASYNKRGCCMYMARFRVFLRVVAFFQEVLNPTPLDPTPATCHKRNGSCTAVFGMLHCRNCTATFASLQCGRHLQQKLRCSKRNIALQHRNRCVAEKWRFPAACLRVSSPHV